MKNLKKLVLLITLVVACGQQAVAMEQECRYPLHRAAKNGHVDDVKRLLSDPHIKVNEMADDGMTALHWATVNDHVEVIKALLDNPHVKVNEKDDFGWTALHRATECGYIKVVKELLDNDRIKVNEKDDDGLTALHYATEGDNVEIVEVLLDNPRVKVNEKDNYGLTALFCAAYKGHVVVAKVLLSDRRKRDKPLDIEAKSNSRNGKYSNMTALDIAKEKYEETNEEKYQSTANIIDAEKIRRLIRMDEQERCLYLIEAKNRGLDLFEVQQVSGEKILIPRCALYF